MVYQTWHNNKYSIYLNFPFRFIYNLCWNTIANSEGKGVEKAEDLLVERTYDAGTSVHVFWPDVFRRP